MPIKTDDKMREIFAPKIKAFTDERLTEENAKRIYDYLKPYHYDTDGRRLYQAAKGILQTDVYSEFPAEDNMGYFELLDGYSMLKWLEIAKFADKEYEQLPGGYEKLKSHAINENSPGYTEYQGKLYAAAVRSIAIDLVDKQPYLLEGFLNRLSYIVNIHEKGLPTRDELNEKIELEYKKVFASATEDDLTSFHSEVEIKCQLRYALRDIYMTDEMVQALYIKDDVLDDAYRFFKEESKDNQVHLAVFEYLEQAEKEYLIDRVYDCMKAEYDAYVDEVKKMPPEKIIDEAYKLTIFHEFLCAFDGEPRMTAEQLKAIMTFDEPLWSFYYEWQRRDWTMQDDIRDGIRDTADEQAAENANSEYELDPNPFGLDDEEAEDGQEP
jgi:hypothetical protein